MVTMRAIALLAAGLGLAGPAATAEQMSPADFEAAAEARLARSHEAVPPDRLPDDADREFQANYEFPAEPPLLAGRPWLDVDPHADWRRYLRTVFDDAYRACGGPDLDWDGRRCGWFHAPGMHDRRD